MKQGTIKSLFIILLGLLVLSNCTQRTKVGFLMDESDYGRWIKDKEMFINKVESMGGEVVFAAAEGDAEKQFELARDLLKQKIDILVVIPTDLYDAARIVKLAHQYGVRAISYDRLIKNCNLDFYISFDNVNVGELQATYLSSACPVGKYAIIGGSVKDNNSFLLRLGQLNILQPLVDRGNIEIVFDQYANHWSVEEGYRLMKECLRKHDQIDAVVSASDELSTGVIKALEEVGLAGKVCVSGQDANLDACKRVLEGTQSMTVYKPIEAIAAKTAEVAFQIVAEQTPPSTSSSVNNGAKLVPSMLLPAMVVNKETIDLTVVADGYLKENNLFDTE